MNPQQKELVTYEGGCHCGAVRFQIEVDQHKAYDCNCSICKKKGFLHLNIPPERFTLLRGAENLSTYTFNTGVAKHTFCKTCGIHSFYKSRSHPKDFDVNVRCLDGDVQERFEIIPFDGANWEKNVYLIQE